QVLRGEALGVGDVAAEPLVQKRPGALALVVPVPADQVLVSQAGVLEVERAVLRVVEARERRVRPEERRDPDISEAAVSRARRVRVERPARDPTAQVAVEAALDACQDRGAVLALRLARARARAGVREERAAIAANQTVRAVVVVLHAEAALLGVNR